MAENSLKAGDGERSGGSGKEGGSMKSSLRSLLPQSSSKESVPSSPNLRTTGKKFSLSRTRSPSQLSNSIDMDSDTDGAARQQEQAATSTSSSRTEREHSPTSPENTESLKSEGLKSEGAVEGTDKDSPVDSDTARDKERKKETSRFFSSPKMRGFMFPFDQISVPMSSHRQKNVELHRIFSSLPSSEKLIDEYSCALQRDILVHGRLYITQNWLCFYANIFTWETLLTIPFVSVTAITKERTAFVFPNAIQITTTAEKYGFSSLMSRDNTYNVLFKIWQNSLLNEHLTPLELVKAARKASGDVAEVGTEENLWGEERPRSGSSFDNLNMPSATASLPAVLPTHVEIMPSAENHTHFTGVGSEVRGDLPGRKSKGGDSSRPRMTRDPPVEDMDQDEASAESPLPLATHEGVDHQTPSVGATSRGGEAGEFPERVSMGGESTASFSEFETLSFADEPGEIPCGCSEHVGRTIINDVYAADVETIFQLLFTDPNFFRDFLKARNTINVDIGEWQEQTDGSKLRDLNYTVALNYSFGPKFSPTIEHQVYSKTAQPGLKHRVHTEVMNRNIPYADTFFVSCQYCMTRVAHDKTRLRITANINFKKSCWGVVKNLIEKNAGDGVRSFYNHLDNFLKEHLASLPVHCKRRHKRSRHASRQRHRKMSQQPKPSPSPALSAPLPRESSLPSSPVSPVAASRPTHPSTASLFSFQLNGSTPTETVSPVSLVGRPAKRSSASFPQVNLALTLLLGILIVSNMALYHHLMSYQSPSKRPISVEQPRPLTERLEWPTSRQEWIALTRKHLESHETQRQQWLDTLSTLVATLEQVDSSLSLAKQVLTENLEALDSPHPQQPSHPPKSHPSPPPPPSSHHSQTAAENKREL